MGPSADLTTLPKAELARNVIDGSFAPEELKREIRAEIAKRETGAGAARG